MLERLTADHVGTTGHYYFDIPFTETIRRHQPRPLPFVDETVIREHATLDQTVPRIITDLKWAAGRRAE